MKIQKIRFAALAAALAIAAAPASAIVVTSTTDATTLASTLAGSGVTVSNAVLTTASPTAAGTFTAGGNIGFDNGVLLTTGTVACAVGPNSSSNCGGAGTTTSLKFNFTSATGNIFFNYIFASEEYPEYVNQEVNDEFQLLINGVNIALVPGTNELINVDNINANKNSAYYRSNANGSINTGYDGLTTVFTAEAFGISGTNTFEFIIRDVGDSAYDSAVFLQAGTFSAEPPADIPEPGSMALLAIGMLGLARYRAKSRTGAAN